MDDAQRGEGQRESDVSTSPWAGAPPTESPFRPAGAPSAEWSDAGGPDGFPQAGGSGPETGPQFAAPFGTRGGPSLPGEVTVDRKGRRRRIRQTATFLFFFLLIVGVGFGAFMAYQGRISLPISEGRPTPLPTCPPPPSPTIQAFTDTNVNVYNASDRKGLALQIARELQKRGFKVPNAPTNDPLKSKPTTAAVIRHGQAGLLAAKTVASVVDGPVQFVPDDRAGDSVDLVLGQSFKLRTVAKSTASAAPSLAAAPSPTCQVPAA